MALNSSLNENFGSLFFFPSIAENCYFWAALAVAPRAVLARRGSCSHFAITQREIAAPNRISPHGKFDFLFRCLLRAIRQQQIGRGRGRRNRDKSRGNSCRWRGCLAWAEWQCLAGSWTEVRAAGNGQQQWQLVAPTGHWQLATGNWQRLCFTFNCFPVERLRRGRPLMPLRSHLRILFTCLNYALNNACLPLPALAA